MINKIKPIFTRSVLLVAALLNIILITSFVSAQADSPQNIIGSEFGISPDKIPSSPEEIKSIYLTQEWSKIIASKPIIGPIHNFFLNNQLAFKILMNTNYEFSLTFLATLILWFFIAFWSSKGIRSSQLIKSDIGSFAIGLLISIILAQIGLIGIIVKGALKLILSPEAWWMRWIIAILIFAALAVLYKIVEIIEKAQEQAELSSRLKSAEQKGKQAEKFIRGAKEGIDIQDKS